jgi:hypothetical protein
MAKRDRTTNQAKIEKWVRAGKGQGRGTDYSPWLTVQDVPSQGLATRIRGYKTKRVHHLLSKLETDFFCLLEFSPGVIDIREQFPLLPLEETLAIAEACDVRHPTDPKSQEAVVMTTDFVITGLRQRKQEEVARTIKYSQDLEAKRTLEKLEIERRYWQSHQVDWGIVTEREIPPVLVQNCRLLRDYLEPSEKDLPNGEIETLAKFLTEKVKQQAAVLRTIALDCDRQLGFAQGTSLAVAYHLIATRQWQIDWQLPLDSGKPLMLLPDHTACAGGVA